MKNVELNKNIYDICKENPEIIRIMKELGFENITEPGMLNTMGRFMTIPKGATMKKIPMDQIEETFRKYGYELK